LVEEIEFASFGGDPVYIAPKYVLSRSNSFVAVNEATWLPSTATVERLAGHLVWNKFSPGPRGRHDARGRSEIAFDLAE